MEKQEDYDDFYDHPLVLKEIDYSKPLHPSTKSIIELRFEGPPEEVALKYKEEGNYLFSKGDYKTALDNYEEGIKLLTTETSLLLLLYTNACVCHRKLLHHKKAIEFGKKALECDQKNLKALTLVASSYLSLLDYDEAVSYFEIALSLKPDDQSLINLSTKAQNLKMVNHNRIIESKRIESEQQKVALEIEKRKININSRTTDWKKIYKLTQPRENFIHHVYLKDDALYWPIAFNFVEPGITDFVLDFNENNIIFDAIKTLLSAPFEWDSNRDYAEEQIEIYYEDLKNANLLEINKNNKLASILSERRLSIVDGVVVFIILSAKSDFCINFKKNYK